jgi:predicted secreted hydrolase
MKRWVQVIIVSGLVALLVGAPLLLVQQDEPQARTILIALADEPTDAQSQGYLSAQGPTPLIFPSDHGPHPDYQNEWWYYTGNLATDDGRQFGYQLTFFRRALIPPSLRSERESAWATDQVYMAHFALTDVDASRYQAYERFGRGAAGLAGAQASPYQVWLEDWSVRELEPGVHRLQAVQDDMAIDLRLSDLKGPILQGDRGYSQKGPEPGNASYYYSLTRLASNGTVRVGKTAYTVDGFSWMDHEYSTNALGPKLVGWDWFSIQLDNGGELMVYQFRREDETIDPYSSGTFITPDGRTLRLSSEEFQVSVGATWRSPRSGATYPSQWKIRVPTADLVLEILPHLADQELNVSFTYWEGAVKVVGEQAGKSLNGNGYVELTGYAGSMQGQF